MRLREKRFNPDHFTWKWYHTLNLLICNVLYSLLRRSVIVFSYALSQALNINISMLSPIIVCIYAAPIISPFIENFTEKYTNNLQLIFIMYSILAGIFSILFGLPFSISKFDNNLYILILYLTIVWLIFSMSQNISKFVSYSIASDYNTNHSKHGRIRSILSGGSWAIASLLFIMQGYWIEYNPSSMFYVIGSIICIFPCLSMVLLPHHNYNQCSNIRKEDKQDKQDLRLLLNYNWLKENSACSLSFLISVIIGISSSSADVLFNPIFMNIYQMSASESGICALSIAFGEISSTLFLTKYSDKWNYFKLIGVSIIFKLLSSIGFVILVLLTNFDDKLLNININIDYNLSVTLSMIFYIWWYFGFEIFYSVQLINCYKFVETKKNTSSTELMLTLNCCAGIGRSIGAVCATVLWQYYKNKSIVIFICAIIWIISIIIALMVYVRLYIITQNDQTFFNAIYHKVTGNGKTQN